MAETWITPRWILDAFPGGARGAFNLDPCCPPLMPWPTARRMWTLGPEARGTLTHHRCTVRDGLAEPWNTGGMVWLNPPYTRGVIGKWMDKMVAHPGGGVALVRAELTAPWFRRCVWGAASRIAFFNRRIHFCHEDGTESKHNSGCPMCLVGFGPLGRKWVDEAAVRLSLTVVAQHHSTGP